MDSGRLRGVTRRWIGRRRIARAWNRWANGVLGLCRTHFLAGNGAVDDLLALVFVHCGQRGDLALFVERRADDLLQYVVADLLGFADLTGNGGAVPAGLFRMSVDKGRRLLGRILRLSTLAGLRPSASGAPFRIMRDILAELRKRNDPQARVIKAKLAEIKHRYAKRPRERPPLAFAALRLRDLEAIFESRWGRHLPDDDAGREDARIAAHHLANLPRGDQASNVISWLARWAPWMSPRQMGVLATEAIERNIKWKADTLAHRMHLADRERSALRITTIGAIDCDNAARSERRQRADRANKESLRRAKGAVPRAEYEANSLAQRKPWTAHGVSRRTWYRRQKTDSTGACGTGPSTAYLSSDSADAPVSWTTEDDPL